MTSSEGERGLYVLAPTSLPQKQQIPHSILPITQYFSKSSQQLMLRELQMEVVPASHPLVGIIFIR